MEKNLEVWIQKSVRTLVKEICHVISTSSSCLEIHIVWKSMYSYRRRTSTLWHMSYFSLSFSSQNIAGCSVFFFFFPNFFIFGALGKKRFFLLINFSWGITSRSYFWARLRNPVFMINQIKPFQWYCYVDLFVLQHIAGQQVGFFCECLFAGTWGSDNIIL